MQRIVAFVSSLIFASTAGSPPKCVIAKPAWIGVGSLGFAFFGSAKNA